MSTLYRKYRPQSWTDIAGQNHIKVTLEFEVATGRIAHAYLFSGPRGTGKTSIARIMAKALNCIDRVKKGDPCGACSSCVSITEGTALDVIEIDAASHRGIDAVRENVIENARFSPSKLVYKVFIIDEVHMLTTEAFNALLKTLEEPPSRVVFILATTELHKVPPTIVSRCQRFDFRKIPFTELVERLHVLAEREKRSVDRRALEEIARNSDGCLRDAEGLLGKVLTVGDGKRVSYDEALVVLPRSEYTALSSFIEALLRRDGRSGLAVIGDCLESGVDLDQFAGEAIELLRKVLLTKLTGEVEVVAFDLDEERKKKLVEWAALAEVSRLVSVTELLLEKRRDMKTSHPLQLPLELAVVRLCEEEREEINPIREKVVATPLSRVDFAHEQATSDEIIRLAHIGSPMVASVREEGASRVPLLEKEGTGEVDTVRTDTAHVTTVELLKGMWSEFIRRAAEENQALPYLLGVGEPIAIEGKKIKIGFDFAFHKDKLNEDKNRKLLEKALGSLLNAAVFVEGVLLEKKERIVHDDAAVSTSQKLVPAIGNGEILATFGGRVVQ